MKRHLEELVLQALEHLRRDGRLTFEGDFTVQIDRPRQAGHGDYATNAALVLARTAGMKPLDLAAAIVAEMPDSRHVAGTEIAPPGFINFRVAEDSLRHVIDDVLDAGEAFGRKTPDPERRITVEFVSANPNGPLHVGHGRGAAYGASLAALLAADGAVVHKEYYVNDNGRQMDILAVSVWLRYLELSGETVPFPANGYRGEYVYDIARTLRKEQGDELRHNRFAVYDGLPPDEAEGGDKEKHIDALIARARQLLGERGYRACFDTSLAAMRSEIATDLAEFGVTFDEWFAESALDKSGAIAAAIAKLDAAGHLYRKDGALWFRAGALGDEKDRVVIRENGRPTYFASDIAYLMNKLERGFSRAIYVFGADHHGYAPRLKAVARGLGEDPERLEIILVQFAVLYRGGQRVQMSTRAGEFVTLRQLREEVGRDAARFFYIMRSHDQHLDFDLDLAKSTSNENPVYYIQYAHARIASVFRILEEQGMRHNRAIGQAALDKLVEPEERALCMLLTRYPETLGAAAAQREPHLLAHYLQELAAALHGFYTRHQILVDDEALRNARLNLLAAVRHVIAGGLALVGVGAPERM